MNLYDMSLVILSSFALGWIMNELTGLNTLQIAAITFCMIMAILFSKLKKVKK